MPINIIAVEKKERKRARVLNFMKYFDSKNI
jgi:hypothetical protein